MISQFENNEFRFLFALFEWICVVLNGMNEVFQSKASHLIWSKSRQLFTQFAKLLMSEDQYLKNISSDLR